MPRNLPESARPLASLRAGAGPLAVRAGRYRRDLWRMPVGFEGRLLCSVCGRRPDGASRRLRAAVTLQGAVRRRR